MKALVYLSPVPWASVAQRPHKFAQWFNAVHGGQVLWLDPYPSRLPRWSDVRRAVGRGVPEPGPVVPPWLEVLKVPALPLEPIPGFAALNGLLWRRIHRRVRRQIEAGGCELVVGKPSRLALSLLQTLRPSRTVYDCMDDFPAFHGGIAGRAMAIVERAIIARADTVYASSGRLKAKLAQLGRLATLTRNACDPQSLPTLEQVAQLRERDLVGYVGTLASWFDWELVAALARDRPDLRFRLIGPQHVKVPVDLPPNVEVRPPCAHAEAMVEMARFAVGLIPFQRNTLTEAVDPVKYYEYRAMGIPVVSTGFGEMSAHSVEDPGVTLTHGRQDAAKALGHALAWAEPPEQVLRFRETNAWPARFTQAAQQ